MKNIVILIVLVIILGGGFLVIKNSSSSKAKPEATPVPTVASTMNVPENKETDAQVSLTGRADKKGIIFKIDNITSDTDSIEYEISYVTKAGLPRGLIGKINSPDTSISKNLDLGTCSRGVCVYDQGVTKVSLNLKFNKSSGESTGFSWEYEL